MSKTVLVVDDDLMICSLCTALLEDAGYNVVTQLSGTRCMSYLRKSGNSPVDLIILDVEMPVMNGFKTLASIRQMTSYAAAPVMFLTSSCSTETVSQAISMGVSDYLKKPFESAELLRRVEKLIGDKKD